MVKSVLAQKLVPVDYDGNGTLDLGFFQSVAGSPPQGNLGVWLLGQSSGMPTAQAGIGATFPYGQTGWVPGFTGEAIWFLNGAALLSLDFNGDGKTDQIFGRLVFSNPNDPSTFQGYELGTWLMNGANVMGYRSIGNASGQTSMVPKDWADPALYGAIRGQGSLGDFNGDGTSDMLFMKRYSNGTTDVGLWLMNDGVAINQQVIANVAAGWNLTNTNDFNGDGTTDLLFVNATSAGTTQVGVWTLNGTQILGQAIVNTAPAGWRIADTNDFSGDGKADILWAKIESDGSTQVGLWTMNGTQASAYKAMPLAAPAGWELIDHNDFNGDGKADLLFKTTLSDGRQQFGAWLLNGANNPLDYLVVDTVAANSNWVYSGSGDTNGDRRADLLFYNTASGDHAAWQLGSTGRPQAQKIIGTVPENQGWKAPFLLDSLSSLNSSGFSGRYALTNWNLENSLIPNSTVYTDGSIDAASNADQLIFYGGNKYGTQPGPRGGDPGTTTYTITTDSRQSVFSFDWTYASFDAATWDFFGVTINGTTTALTDVPGTSGSFSQVVNPNSTIGFVMGTADNRYGSGYATITDFDIAPLFGNV
jgi:hypothetical protein